MQDSAEIGIIGGSGFYSLLSDAKKLEINTEHGKPSDLVSVGMLEGRSVAFIPRHGTKHTIPPHRVPYKANIDALKGMGVKRIIATNAVGSLSEDYGIGDFVFFDQFVNMSHGRDDTFYNGGKVAHVSTADPYCSEMRGVAIDVADGLGIRYHKTGTVVVISGPRFSTKAESRLFSKMGFQTIGMTQYPEVALARERELCYLGIGLVTDYDAGLEGNDRIKPVSNDEVQNEFAKNIEIMKKLVAAIVKKTPKERSCDCGTALKGAVIGE